MQAGGFSRRSRGEEMNFCEQHQQLFADIQVIKERTFNIDKRVNGSIDAEIEQRLKEIGDKLALFDKERV